MQGGFGLERWILSSSCCRADRPVYRSVGYGEEALLVLYAVSMRLFKARAQRECCDPLRLSAVLFCWPLPRHLQR